MNSIDIDDHHASIASTYVDKKRKTGKESERKDEIPYPEIAIEDKIIPEDWHNIPVCLVKAFKVDVDNQVYLESFCKVLLQKVDIM
jgi:hypothetical protein